MDNLYDLIVVGGGASGLIAAGRAAERGLRVLLLEKNRTLGDKLRITGGGRCNITNAEENLQTLLAKYGKAEQFLYSLFAQFDVKSTFDFFESLGLPLIVQEHKRAFPKTEKAEDVIRVLKEYLQRGVVEIRTNSPVTKVIAKDNAIVAVQCGEKEFVAKEYLFATGCHSHRETGATSDGFRWLASLGHTVLQPTPTLVPLKVKEQWVKELSGVSVPNMKISFFGEGKKKFVLAGKILFTHFGLSGPLILNNAHKVADLLQSGKVTATIDIVPQTDHGELNRTIISIFGSNNKKELKNCIQELLPDGMQKGILLLLSKFMDVSTKVHSITKEERKRIVHLLKELPISIEGLMGFDRAIVADGGIPLEEIDLKTMHSKIIPNLLVTGDLLHITRPSGGYSLQLCWSTGYVAGSQANK